MNIVGITKANPNNINESIQDLLDSIGYKPIKDRILLKPNIVVAASPEEGAITHPKVIEALVHYFRKMKKEVVIAEGTGIFSTDKEFEKLLNRTGYNLIRENLNVPIINLEKEETIQVPWRFGFIPVPKILKDYEYINVPSMKTHSQTTVTLGTKNQKGLIPMKTKKIFHKMGLHSCILEFSKVIWPTLTVVDALYCIEGTGPTGPPVGKVKKMDLLVAGQNMMAVDNVCVEIMGFDIKEIKHLMPVEDIQIIGEKIDDVRSKFEKPLPAFGHDPFILYGDETTCTMCTVSFYKAYSKIVHTPELNQELKRRNDLNKIGIIMGKSGIHFPGDCSTIFCIGDCSLKTARKMGLPHIRGCHPDYRKIVNFLFPDYYPEVTDEIDEKLMD